MDYVDFRDRIKARWPWGSVRRFAEIANIHRVVVCQWSYCPGWVQPLLDAWDEIDRLRALIPADAWTPPTGDIILPEGLTTKPKQPNQRNRKNGTLHPD